jgi:cytochrome b561
MRPSRTRPSASAAVMLWTCTALFAIRVIAQLEALLVAPPWLPDMDAWYSGLMPYHVLLPAQIAILMVMAVVSWNRRVRDGRFARVSPRVTKALRIFAGSYFLVMAVRLGFNISENGADFWREGAIPVAFHWVLALFVLVSGRASSSMRSVGVPAEHQHESDEADDIPDGDVPALPQPLAYGFGLRTQVGHRHAR